MNRKKGVFAEVYLTGRVNMLGLYKKYAGLSSEKARFQVENYLTKGKRGGIP